MTDASSGVIVNRVVRDFGAAPPTPPSAEGTGVMLVLGMEDNAGGLLLKSL